MSYLRLVTLRVQSTHVADAWRAYHTKQKPGDMKGGEALARIRRGTRNQTVQNAEMYTAPNILGRQNRAKHRSFVLIMHRARSVEIEPAFVHYVTLGWNGTQYNDPAARRVRAE